MKKILGTLGLAAAAFALTIPFTLPAAADGHGHRSWRGGSRFVLPAPPIPRFLPQPPRVVIGLDSRRYDRRWDEGRYYRRAHPRSYWVEGYWARRGVWVPGGWRCR